MSKILRNVPIQKKITLRKLLKNFENFLKIHRKFAQKFKKFFKIVLEIKLNKIKIFKKFSNFLKQLHFLFIENVLPFHITI